MIQRYFRIVCDDCGEHYDWGFEQGHVTVAEARTVAVEAGWVRRGRWQTDLCPSCAKKGMAW